VVPVYAQLAADFETPLSAYMKIRTGKGAFLFESAESTEKSGRWSIIGSHSKWVLQSRSGKRILTENGEERTYEAEGDILAQLEERMSAYHFSEVPGLPPFCGGAVGYLSYDAVREFEPSIGEKDVDELQIPEALFMLTDSILVFDHKLRRLQIIANAFLDDADSVDEAYATAVDAIHSLAEKLSSTIEPHLFDGLAAGQETEIRSNTSQAEYEGMVTQAKEYIKAGDAFQIVPSQRFETDFSGSAVDLYRSLRHVNPSPYMFIMELEGYSLVGSSPETHVKVVDGRIDIRPIAGTRWRGKTPEEDDALAEDLLGDEKECAEHLMLVDLARNDVGRVSQHGTVQVDNFMTVERYSHVMHIVSNVTGSLSPEQSSYDVLRATFPAGTVSGAPKIRAMQIINELEKSKRATYSGAVGYFGWDGSHDSCIALRTCLLKDGKAYVQAGAGVVADSDPTYEYEETRNKASALFRAISLAKTID